MIFHKNWDGETDGSAGVDLCLSNDLTGVLPVGRWIHFHRELHGWAVAWAARGVASGVGPDDLSKTGGHSYG